MNQGALPPRSPYGANSIRIITTCTKVLKGGPGKPDLLGKLQLKSEEDITCVAW